MNKKTSSIMLFFILVLLNFGLVFAAQIQAQSRIDSVTVYPDSAMITRVAELKLDEGQHSLIFADIIPEIDEGSLKISGQGSAQENILGAQIKKEFLEEVPAERARRLKEEIEKLEDDKRRLQDSKNVLIEEKEYLDSIKLFSGQQLPKDLVTKMPSPQELDNTYKFLDTKLKENFSLVMEDELKIRGIDKKIQALRNELSQISGYNRKMKRSIVVDVEVIKPGDFVLSVSYLVHEAYWQPIYDARADFAKSQVELVLQGLSLIHI